MKVRPRYPFRIHPPSRTDTGGGSRTHILLFLRQAPRHLGYAGMKDLKGSGRRTRTPISCSKDRGPAVGRSRNERTRHDSNVRPQASGACALIRLSYGSEGEFGGRCESRTHRGFQAPTVFKTAWRARAQPSPVRQGRLELPRSRRATALQTAAGPVRRLAQIEKRIGRGPGP